MRFRPAGPADAAAVAALVHSAYRGETSRAGWTTEADLLDGDRIDVAQVLEDIADPDGLILLAEDDDGALTACAHLQRHGDGPAYFGMFAVRPGQQGAGTGRIVLAEAERIAATELGAATVEMQVIAQRAELIAWYERHGYARTGATRPFPYGDERFGRPRRDDLHFVVLEKALPAADGDAPRTTAQANSDSSR